ncbi:HPr family phosphocarrier protein [Streptomyces sp. NPDC054842]
MPVTVASDGKDPVDARSVLGLMTLGVVFGDQVVLRALRRLVRRHAAPYDKNPPAGDAVAMPRPGGATASVPSAGPAGR